LALSATFVLAAAVAPAAHAAIAFEDPLFVATPNQPAKPPVEGPVPPPVGNLEGPCGLAVDGGGNFYVSDYYHHAIDLYHPIVDISRPENNGATYLSQSTGIDPLDGPCGLALDAFGNLYVNDFHRDVTRYTGGVGTVIDSAHPTGVAVDTGSNDVYVDDRTQVTVYSPSGVELGQIGNGSLLDGYGVAVSGFAGTIGDVYVPDAATNTIKVYPPTLGATSPIATIDGSGTPNGHFISLRNASIAIDNSTGEIYVTDMVEPEFSERAETVVWVFTSGGAYEGRLKYSVSNSLPVGLAVDNSGTASQGRVYVTSGNTIRGSIYAYRAHAATPNSVPLPPSLAAVSAGPSGPATAAAAASAPVVTSPTVAAAVPATAGPAASTVTSPTPAARKRASKHHRRPARTHRADGRRR